MARTPSRSLSRTLSRTPSLCRSRCLWSETLHCLALLSEAPLTSCGPVCGMATPEYILPDSDSELPDCSDISDAIRLDDPPSHSSATSNTANPSNTVSSAVKINSNALNSDSNNTGLMLKRRLSIST